MPCSWKRTWSEQEGRFDGAGGCGGSRFCREFDSRHMGNWQISIPSTVAVAGGGVQSITPRPNPDSPGALGHGIQSLTSGSVTIGGVREALARIYTRTSTFDKRSSINRPIKARVLLAHLGEENTSGALSKWELGASEHESMYSMAILSTEKREHTNSNDNGSSGAPWASNSTSPPSP